MFWERSRSMVHVTLRLLLPMVHWSRRMYSSLTTALVEAKELPSFPSRKVSGIILDDPDLHQAELNAL